MAADASASTVNGTNGSPVATIARWVHWLAATGLVTSIASGDLPMLISRSNDGRIPNWRARLRAHARGIARSDYGPTMDRVATVPMIVAVI